MGLSFDKYILWVIILGGAGPWATEGCAVARFTGKATHCCLRKKAKKCAATAMRDIRDACDSFDDIPIYCFLHIAVLLRFSD